MATLRGFEPLTLCVTGTRADQLHYRAKWLRWLELNQLPRDNETRDLTACPLCYVVASERFERCLLVMSQMSYHCSTLAICVSHFVDILYQKIEKISNFGSSLRIRTET